MRIVYAEKALQDMGWFRRYYSRVFPEGRGNARDSLLRTERMISENSFLGQPADVGLEAREFPILRTPFTVIYRVRPDQIEILRILDLRAET